MVLYMPTVSFHGTWYSEIFFTLELLSTGRNFPHDVQGFNILEPCKNHSRNLYNGKLENFHQSGPDLGVDDLQLSITTSVSYTISFLRGAPPPKKNPGSAPDSCMITGWLQLFSQQ